MQPPPIGFLHVPKTGGTTLGTVLEDLFIPQLGVRSYNFHMNPDWRKSPDPFAYEEAFFKDANYDMYRGHIHYHPHPKIRWLSMVRHPVSHFISWFYSWFKLMRVHESYPQEIRDLYDCTLEEYLDEFQEAWSQEPWPQTHYDYTWSKRPLSQLNYFSRSNNIQEALERVRSEAIVTGLFERYQESMALYNAALNLPLPVDPVKKNIGSYAPPSTEIKERIASLIPLEMEFYQGVKEIFQNSLERYGIDREKIEALGRKHRVRHDPPIVFLERKTHNRRLSHYQTLNCIGTGEVFRAFIKNRENDCPIKLLDWNEGTWGQTIEGHTVLSPDHLANDYQDLARDLLGQTSISHPEQALPGMDVVLGGGFGTMEKPTGSKSHGKNFVPGWKYISEETINKADVKQGGKYTVALRTPQVKGKDGLKQATDAAIKNKTRLLGVYGVEKYAAHLPYQTANGDYQPAPGLKNSSEVYSESDIAENPTLADMTESALSVLSQNKQGFWLLVEAGDVDWANHDNNLDNAIGAVKSGDDAFKVITDWVEKNSNWDETLVILTADHGHYLNIDQPEALIPQKKAAK